MKIIYMDIDTLRPDHLGCYGYHRNTSPNIDEFAKDSIVFEECYCSDAPCLPSRTALMSGRFGIHTGVVGHGGTAGDIRLTGAGRGIRSGNFFNSWVAKLRKCGYKTASVSPFADRHSSYHFNMGFAETYDTGDWGMESAEHIMPVAFDWLDRNAHKEENWFLHVNIWDPHTPYRAPLEYGNKFENDPMPEWITQEVFEKHREAVGSHTCQDVQMFTNQIPFEGKYPRDMGEFNTIEDVKKFMDGYDMGVWHADKYFGLLVEKLKEMSLYDDIMIILSSDHGEDMGEFGIYGEHGMADYATTHIPLIIKHEKAKKGTRDSKLHYNLDLAPTMADLFGFEKSPNWDGQSYATNITEGTEIGHDELIVGQCAHVCQRGVRFDDYMYIRIYHDGGRLFSEKEMLFDIKNDPFMQYNLASEKPDVVKDAVYRLTNWHDDMMSTSDSEIDPLWTVMKEGGPFHADKPKLQRYVGRLEEEGRFDVLAEFKEKYEKYMK